MIYAKYTITLKTLLDDPKTKALIDNALSTYPLYDPENEPKFSKVFSREELNNMILNHFKYREIGFETFGRFLDELEITMNEIMPTYNQHFCSQDIINGLEDIFGNVDMLVEFEETKTGNSSSDTDTTQNGTLNGSEDVDTTSNTSANSNGTDSSTTSNTMDSDSKTTTSNTPQSELSITAANIDNVSYADKVEWNKQGSNSQGTSEGSTSSTATSEATGTTKGTKSETREEAGSIKTTGTTSETIKNSIHRKGNQGVQTYAHDMLQFRELFINVAQMIIKDPRMQELFMGIY